MSTQDGSRQKRQEHQNQSINQSINKYDTDFKEGVRSALFLVIHAPRRGLLEVWPALGGKRVAAFNVDKTAR